MRLCAAVCAAVLLLVLWPVAPVPVRASTSIRVGVVREVDRVSIVFDRPVGLIAGPLVSLRLEPGAYDFVARAAGIEVAGAGTRFENSIRLSPTEGGRLYIGIRPYRGLLELRRTGSGRLTVINEVDLEEYLYGVLKMEVDPEWPADALKAQAVAARTLALQSMGRFASEGYDVRATTDTQVYGGISAEDPRTTAAVEDTRGEIMTYEGRPIFAAYHSDSGGYTESSELVWGGRYPYLQAVPDPYSTGAPNHEWMVRMDLPAFEERLRRAGRSANGITGIEVVETTPSGRVGLVRITGTHGVVTVKGTDLRAIMGATLLRSTLFIVRITPDEQPLVEFLGRGSGHGVGLSQWGARGMAASGRTYTEILKYYYTGIEISRSQ
ncbi:MAG: SpoIID/LytB domain-containing protein [Bacillati bacterium ANGP1]|uniref:SpoIID/LytB domain-containing protein n=1 Tax=Candidatus Segetimicrobium genomatis TaxID=2569760 RepID=A0A537IVG9_9BACT|nr:MAG: SpoIID/LytB domain-containing protein [Terrabacteria group bacterium ANGP1]